MNNIIKGALKAHNLKSLLNPVRNLSLSACKQQRQYPGMFWYAGSFHFETKPNVSNNLCTSGCGVRGVSTRAERELALFLKDEINVERKAQKEKTIPAEIDGFQAQLNGAEVTLTKQIDNEKIKIQFNVNHSVDTDPEADIHPEMDKPEMAELKSLPNFKIDMIRGNTTVSLVCSFNSSDHQDGEDVFRIDEISIYEGDWNENVYSVSGEVLDTVLYSYLMDYLDEKGITNEFAEKLSEYSTGYEHSAYISLLEGLSKFVSEK